MSRRWIIYNKGVSMKWMAAAVFFLGAIFVISLFGGCVSLNRNGGRHASDEDYQIAIEPVYRSRVDGTGVKDNEPGQMRVTIYKEKNIGWKGMDGWTEFWFTKENGKWKSVHLIWYLDEQISGAINQTLPIGTNPDVPLWWQPLPFDDLKIASFEITPARCSAGIEVEGETKEETLKNAERVAYEAKQWMERQHFVCP